MTEIGFVDKISDGVTTVRVAKKSACGENCASCKGGCTPGERILEVKNPIGAMPGERVILELPDGRFLTAAFLVYILPLVMFITGYFMMGTVFDAEWQMMFGGAMFCVLGFIMVKIVNKKNKEKYMAEIVKVCE